MSLIPLEVFLSGRPTYHHHYTPNLMASLLNDSFGQFQQLERQFGQLQTDVQVGGDEDGKYTFKCSVAGYQPQELSVDVQGEELVIQGKHQQQGDGQSIHRTFERRMTLPSSVDKQSIQCHLDEQGRLQVQAARKGVEKMPAKVNIPIGFRPSTDQQQLGNGKEDKKTSKN